MQAVKKIKKIKIKRAIFIISMLAIPLTIFFTFWIGVNGSTIIMAFRTKGGGFSFSNFTLFFEELQMADSKLTCGLLNTFKYFGVTVFFSTPACLLTSYFIYKKIFLKKYFSIVFFLPCIIPMVVTVSLYKNMINPDGIIPLLYSKIANVDLGSVPIFLHDVRYATTAIIFYNLWMGFGSSLLLYGGAMNRIPAEVIESAKIDGVGFFGEFLKFVLPLIWPTFSTMEIMSFAGIFSAGGPILLFTQGNYDTFTLTYWIFDKVASYSSNYEYAAAVGLLMTAVAMPLTMLCRWVLSKIGSEVEY